MRHNYAYLDDGELANDPRLAYVRPTTRARWLRMIGEGTPERKAIFAREQTLVGQMAKAGVGILAGTDNGNPFCFPGFSLHDELEMLVHSGLSPAEALRAATTDATRLLHIDAGSDFVLLDANPLEDIRNTKRIHAVVIRGRYLDRTALDDLLARARSVIARP